jgi:hypothetical protein
VAKVTMTVPLTVMSLVTTMTMEITTKTVVDDSSKGSKDAW